ncbi:MAG TPA: hypothetical protein VFJ30_02715 [Phycisphaerae bacterium]|nr:hypothetical protein [Phycisphaerae bacterium]
MARTSTAAKDVWIACDRWPDAKDLRRWAKDAFRIEKARTPQQRAIALWKWLHICQARSAPAWREGGRGQEAVISDTLKYLNVYVGHYCDGLGRLMANAWTASGAGRGRKTVIKRLGHTVAELRYRDADGRTRWHAFDPQNGWYVFARDGRHVASIAEVDADPDLLLHPADPPRPYFFAASSRDAYVDREATTRYAVEGDAPMPTHRMRLDLRPGQTWRRLWKPGAAYWPYSFGPEPKPIAPAWTDADVLGGGIADTFLGEYVTPYLYRQPAEARGGGGGSGLCRMHGSVELTWDVPLAGGAFGEGAARVLSVAGEARASRRAALVHPARTGKLSMLVYEVATPYIITDSVVEAVGRSGPDPQDMLALHASVDGGLSWQLVWGRIFASKRPNPRPRRIRTAFGQEAYHEGRFSAVGKYGYLLRIDMLARRDPADVGLDSLTIRTSCQCNMMSLPALLPGLNRIRVTTASAPAAGKLRVEYHWTEKPRGLRKAVKLLPARGGTFTLRAGGTAPSDIRMREVSVALV